MVAINIKSNIKQFTRRLTYIQRKQVPFATMLALNDTIFQVRKRIVERTWPRSFKVRNRRFASTAFRVKKASKRNLTATLFDRLGRASMGLHAAGGTKRPRAKHLAVPTSNVKRTASGKVGKARRPRAVLSKGKAFKGTVKNARPAIFERVGPKGRRLKLLFNLTTAAPIKKRFPFYEDAQDTTNRAFDNNFFRRLKRALATAR